jgi:hypothetical protein
VRRARTSAKEGSLFFLLCVQSSAWFSSIVGGTGGVGGDGEGEGDRPATVSGRERRRQPHSGKLRIPQPCPLLPPTTTTHSKDVGVGKSFLPSRTGN